MRVTIHPAAVAEARAARLWYAGRDLAAADAFTAELERAVAAVARLPTAWPPFEAGTRRFLLRRFPYAVIYRVREQGIQVVAVMHQRRRPGYWNRR